MWYFFYDNGDNVSLKSILLERLGVHHTCLFQNILFFLERGRDILISLSVERSLRVRLPRKLSILSLIIKIVHGLSFYDNCDNVSLKSILLERLGVHHTCLFQNILFFLERGRDILISLSVERSLRVRLPRKLSILSLIIKMVHCLSFTIIVTMFLSHIRSNDYFRSNQYPLSGWVCLSLFSDNTV